LKSKNKTHSIQFKTLSCLIIFSVIILIVLWAIQILFMRVYYEIYQVNTLKNIVNSITSNTYTINELETLAYKNDVCMEYIYYDKVYLFNGLNNKCILNNKNTNIIIKKFIMANKEKEIIKLNNPINDSKSILYNIKLENNQYVFLNTSLEDVGTTTSILTNQLIYVTIIVILVAIIVSVYLSRMLNKPIINITKYARELAKGNKDIKIEKSNIYEIDELADALNYANKEINKTDQLRRDLLSNVSHDLKTPLTMIKAYAELIKDLKLNKKEREENLNIIIDETDRLNLLVNDILNLSKLENNVDELDIKEFDLVELINNILNKYKIIKETENYIFETKLPNKAIVLGDVNKISQVIYNLINNAINYTGKDNLIKIEVEELRKSYRVNIIDTGNGINEEEINIIWDKYYKNEKNHKRSKIGTGIGLSIVKNILDKHNYIYGVKSRKNKGTIFYFEISKIS